MDASNAPTEKLPKQVPYIIGNEACERFSFYGMRNILTVFLIDYLLVSEGVSLEERTGAAKATFHLFVSAVYFFPIFGGLLSDLFLGKYRTILYLSIVYCFGHLCLALFDDNKNGFYFGLFLIALGSGGIKPCVSAMVGDQFTDKNKALATKVFGAFYWSINFGSFFASLLIPVTLKTWGPSVAFGIPGILMAIATVIFWLGRKLYVQAPKVGADPHGFWKVVFAALKNRAAQGSHWLDKAKGLHPESAVEGAKAAFRMLLVFLPIPFFWALFDQKASTWVVQAKSMDKNIFGLFEFQPSQMQFVNPALVMMLIPLTAGVIYPAFKRWGYELTPLRRMTIGMAIGALSYVVAGLIQVPISNGEKLSILWQLLPYLLLTTAEVLVSTTGLEFAYSQAPREMKGTLMAFWNLTVTAGNLAVALASAINIFQGGPPLFFFYAGLAFVAAIALGFIARNYKTVDQYGAAAA
jgi:proton-dependent oligopeptide transporter, POT family